MDLRDFLAGWFHGAAHEDIKQQNVEELIAYGFFNKPKAAMAPSELSQVRSMLQQAERAFQVSIPPGRTPGLSFMAHSWEPMRVVHKPLLFYLATHSGGLLSDLLLACLGFKRCLVGGLACWVRKPAPPPHQQPPGKRGGVKGAVANALLGVHAAWVVAKQYVYHHLLAGVAAYQVSVVSYVAVPQGPTRPAVGKRASGQWEADSEDSLDSGASQHSGCSRGAGAARARTPRGGQEPVPLVFLHGVGVGIAPYIHVLRHIMGRNPQRPMLLVDVPCVSLRLGWAARGFDEVADAVACAARAHGWPRVSVLSHSYGTFVTSVLVKRHPALVAGVCMVDPVCLLTCYPQLLRNFIYQAFKRPNMSLATVLKDGTRLLAARDYLVAHTFCRMFLWHEVQLWPHQFPPRAVVMLSGLDPLVPHDLAVRHLEGLRQKQRVKVISNEQHSHGSFLMDPSAITRLVDAMDTCLWHDEGVAEEAVTC